jgi:hypothetical protein
LDWAYIGSTIRPEKRWEKEHLPALRKGRHENRALQECYDKVGEDKIKYVLVEVVDDMHALPDWEKLWIQLATQAGVALNEKETGSPGTRGKKLSDETRQKQSLAKRGRNHPDNRKDYAFLSPDGKLHTPHGTEEFCIENGLSRTAISRVWNGRQKAHRGWKRIDKV